MFYMHYRKSKAVGMALISDIEHIGGQKLFRQSICECFFYSFQKLQYWTAIRLNQLKSQKHPCIN